jgi:hypothetical protein
MKIFILDPSFLHIGIVSGDFPVRLGVIVLPEVRSGKGKVFVNVWIVDKNLGIPGHDYHF